MLQFRFVGADMVAGTVCTLICHRVHARGRLDQPRHHGDHGLHVHDIALRALAARHAQKMLRDAAAAQDLFARDGGALADMFLVRFASAGAANSRMMPSTHMSTVARGVFNSCEKPDASVPMEASR